VVVGIAWQDQAMAQGLCVLGLRLSHARQVPRILSGFRRWSLREKLSCQDSVRNWTVTGPRGAADLAGLTCAEGPHTKFMSAKKYPHLVGVKY
jgi:hypothetical protein